MKEITLAICDDSEMDLEAISGSIVSTFEHYGITPHLYKYNSPLLLRNTFSERQYAIIFLDIDMPGLDGISLGRIIKATSQAPEIIFISAREEKVFDSLSIHPFGFVRKSNFIRDISGVLKYYIETKQNDNHGNIVEFKTGSAIVTENIDEIFYIESSRDYQYVYIKNKKDPLELRTTMDELEGRLTPQGFIRISKGYLVNYRFISRIESLNVILNDGTALPISRRKLQDTRAQYLKFLRSTGSIMIGHSEAEGNS